MAINRYQPQTRVAPLPEVMNRLFNESFIVPAALDRYVNGGARASTNASLCETPDGFVMWVAIPGVKADDLDIQVVGREIAVKGHFELDTPPDATWIWQGLPTGEFYESFTLPAEVENTRVRATFEHGILKMELPKAEHLRPKSIKVQTTT